MNCIPSRFPLGEVCKFIGGGTPSKKTSAFYGGEIPWATVRDMKQDLLSETEHKITTEAVKHSSTNIIPSQNVVIASRVGLGKICFIEQDTAINQDLRAVIPHSDQQLSKLFLFWWFKSIANKIVAAGKGATVQGVTLPFLKSLEIPMPSLPEQKHIVAILDEAFEGIATATANAEKNLANAKELFDSYLNSVFTEKGEGWVEKRLGDLAEVQSGGTPLKSKKHYWNGSIAWYSSGELNDLYTQEPASNITQMGLSESNAKLFPQGSLLIGMYDTAALKMSLIDRDAAFNQAIAGVKPQHGVNLTFVMYAIHAIKPEILAQRRGVRQKNLNLTKIKNIPIPIPEFHEQHSVVDKLNDLRQNISLLESIYQQKLHHLTELKQSILQKAFSGELTQKAA